VNGKRKNEEREALKALKALSRMDLYVKMEISREGGGRVWYLDKGR